MGKHIQTLLNFLHYSYILQTTVVDIPLPPMEPKVGQEEEVLWGDLKVAVREQQARFVIRYQYTSEYASTDGGTRRAHMAKTHSDQSQ